MRWPFRPPHLTLKPSQKEQEKQKTQKQKEKTERKNKKTQIRKKSFSVMSQFFLSGGCPKVPFFDNLAKTRAPQNTIKIGVSARHF